MRGPYLKIENNTYICGIYPLVICNPPPFHYSDSNTFYIEKNVVLYKNQVIPLESLEYVLLKKYKMLENHSGSSLSKLVVFMFRRPLNETMDGVEFQLKRITEVYDSINPNAELSIVFIQLRKPSMPLPKQ